MVSVMTTSILLLLSCVFWDNSVAQQNGGVAVPSSSLITILDLTHEMHEDAPNWPTFPPFSRNVTIGGSEEEGDYYKVERICTPTHLGTHLDAPCHFNTTRWCIADIPLERLILVPASVIDIRHKVFGPNFINPEAEVTIQDILDWEAVHGRIPDHSVVLFLTGWERFYGSDALFRGTPTSDASLHRFPGLAMDAADWLAKSRPLIYGVGIDTSSIDFGRTNHFESHQFITARNMYIMEMLANMDKLPPTGALLNIGALRIGREASAAPARVVATLFSSTASIHK